MTGLVSYLPPNCHSYPESARAIVPSEVLLIQRTMSLMSPTERNGKSLGELNGFQVKTAALELGVVCTFFNFFFLF